MKVLLELLGDTSRILSGVEGMDDFRPDTRQRVRKLLEKLKMEVDRILATADSEADGEQRDAFLQRALEAMTNNDYDIARGVLEDGAAEFPDDFEMLNYLGLVAWEQDDLSGAEVAYQRAMQSVFEGVLDPEAVDGASDQVLRAVEGRALCLYRLDRRLKALEYFEWLAEHFPEEYVGCRYLAGEIHHLNGDVDEAIERYRDVPVEPAVLYNLGLAYFENHRLNRAAKTWIRALVSNVHIAVQLLDRPKSHSSCTPGYLGSERYARDFVGACLRLWHGADGSLRFLERCFEHPAVQSHLERCRERGGAGLLQSGEGAMQCAGWLEQLQDEETLTRLSTGVVDRYVM